MTDDLETARSHLDLDRPLPPFDGMESVASFESHDEAHRAVEAIVAGGFPLDRVAVVGRGLQIVEQITGPVAHGRSALEGALVGALTGGVGASLTSAFAWPDELDAVTTAGVALGIVIGLAVGLFRHPWRPGQGYASTTSLRAAYFDVVAPIEAAETAARILDDTQRHELESRRTA